MRAFDRDEPANLDERIFAFIEAYGALNPEIGEKDKKVYALQGCRVSKALEPSTPAKKWLTGIRQ